MTSACAGFSQTPASLRVALLDYDVPLRWWRTSHCVRRKERFGVRIPKFVADFFFEVAALLFDRILRLKAIAHLPQFVE